MAIFDYLVDFYLYLFTANNYDALNTLSIEYLNDMPFDYWLSYTLGIISVVLIFIFFVKFIIWLFKLFGGLFKW